MSSHPIGLRRRQLLNLCAGLPLAGAPLIASRTVFAQPSAVSDAEALHLLNRLSWGPAPGDVMRMQQMGPDAWVDEQLHPQRLPLPEGLTRALDALPFTHLSQRDAVSQYRRAAQQARRDPEAGKEARQEMLKQLSLEAGEARLLRAVGSPHQLQEVMVEFWFNHFNVFAGKGLDRVLVENYEQEAIRPHVLGRFRDLLGATAHHPAMLFYLDNWQSVAPGFQPRHAGAKNAPTGLNENYARELMELHTLGVDGGYSQSDVTELARMLTGWTFDLRAHGSSLFMFDPQRHDMGSKNWLGQTVAARGQAEGEWALDQLARHPSTARHISDKLAQYFVADEPPAALVDKLSRRFTTTDGDIRAVLQTLFASPEFRDPARYGAKFKTPYRYVVSALRASAIPVSNVRPLLGALRQQGMPLYGCPTPDGYKNTEQAWLNPEAITRRVGFANALASGRLSVDRPTESLPPMANRGNDAAPNSPPSPQPQPVDLNSLLATLGSGISGKTRAALQTEPKALQAALVLGSPDFMRH